MTGFCAAVRLPPAPPPSADASPGRRNTKIADFADFRRSRPASSEGVRRRSANWFLINAKFLDFRLAHGYTFCASRPALTLWEVIPPICHNLPMCGRYKLSWRKQIIGEHFDSVSGEDWSPR